MKKNNDCWATFYKEIEKDLANNKIKKKKSHHTVSSKKNIVAIVELGS